jgi:hypothetical protein
MDDTVIASCYSSGDENQIERKSSHPGKPGSISEPFQVLVQLLLPYYGGDKDECRENDSTPP